MTLSDGGVFQSSGLFNRTVVSGTPGTDQVTWGSGGGGFAAVGEGLTVTLTVGSIADAQLTWGQSGFVNSVDPLHSDPLVFGSSTADATVVWTNPIQLTNTSSSTMAVRNFVVNNDASSSVSPQAEITGVISDYSGGPAELEKSGNGVLALDPPSTPGNSFTGAYVLAGTLVASSRGALAQGAFLDAGPNSGLLFQIALSFPSNVYVSGTPQIQVATASGTRTASYTYGSGTSSLVFQYPLQPGESLANLAFTGPNSIDLNGGTIITFDPSTGQYVNAALGLPSPQTFSALVPADIDVADMFPFVEQISRVGPPAVDAGPIQFAVQFSKTVLGVSASDFALALTGTATGTITALSGGGEDYIVTVNGVSGNGSLGLNLVDNDSIVDASGNPLGGVGAGNGDFTGATYTVASTLPYSASGANLSATEGTALENVLVASFIDSRGVQPAANYSAVINWGDGQTSTVTGAAGQIVAANGGFDVNGSHTYSFAGSYTVTVSISDANGFFVMGSSIASVAVAPLIAMIPSGLSFTEGAQFSGIVATFVDTGVPLDPENYAATILWGDRQTSVGTVSFNSATQQFQVAASNVYVLEGPYSINVAIVDAEGAATDTSTAITVADAPLVVSGQNVMFTTGTLFSGTVATFTHIGGSQDTSTYTATITWTTGQGVSTTAGTVTYNASTQQFTVSGSFTFPADTGNSISVAVNDNAGTAVTVSSTPSTLSISLVEIAPAQDVPFNGTVASFTDTDLGSLGIYSATIFWGDGGQSAGTVTYNSQTQQFGVSGSHTYQARATADALFVVVNGTERTTIEATRNIAVADAPLTGGVFTPPDGLVEGTLVDAQVYSFSDANPNTVAGDFTAFIDFGNSTETVTSAAGNNGQIVPDTTNGGFDVLVNYLYISAFSGATFSVLVTDGQGAACAASQSDFSVADAPLTALSYMPPTLGATSFTDVPLFKFADGNSFENGSDLVATISWGDGTNSTARVGTSGADYMELTVVNSDETVWEVYGSHTYQGSLNGDTFSVQINDASGASTGDSGTITVPVVTSINTEGSAIAAGASTVRFAVRFSGIVTGVQIGDFALSGGNSSGTISSVSGSGSSYTVTVTGVTGTGTLGLNLVDNDTIVDAYGKPLGSVSAGDYTFTGKEYALSASFYWNDASGSGNFNDANWAVGSPSGPTDSWVSGALAIFPVGTGTVTMAGQTHINTLTFEGGGAVLQESSSSDSLALLGSGSVTVDAGTATIDVALTGSGGLLKFGSGTLLLGGANTYTGLSEVVGGTVKIGSSSALGAGLLRLDNSGTIVDLNGFNTTLNWLYGSGTITDNSSGSGTTTLMIVAAAPNYFYGQICDGTSQHVAVSVVGQSNVVFTGNNTYTGGTAIAAGAELDVGYVGSAGSIVGSVSVSGALYFMPAASTGFYGDISGTGNVYIESPQTFDLGGDNSQFSGGFSTYGTTIRLDNPNALGNSTIDLSDPNLAGRTNLGVWSTLDLNGNSIVINLLYGTGTIMDDSSVPGVTQLTVEGGSFYDGQIEDGPVRQLALNKIGPNDLILINSSQYTGGTTIEDGTLEMRTGGLITGSVVDNGWLDFAQYGNESLIFAGNISGSGIVTHDGSMPLTLSGNISGGVKVIQYGPGTLMLSGDNSYTGGTGVLSTLIVGGPSALPAANLALYSGGTINLNGYNVTLDAFWNNGGTITDNSSSSGVTTLTLDTGSGAYYYGTIQDGANGRQVAVEVAGGGLILYGANTYTGGTTIDAGTQLIVGYFGDTGSLTGNIVDNGQLFFATAGTTVYSGNISGSGSVVVCVPGTLILTGNATVTGGTTVDAGSTLQISDGTTNGSVTGSIVDNAILDFVLNSVATVNTAISGNSASQIVNNGAGELTLTGLDAYYGSLGSGIQT